MGDKIKGLTDLKLNAEDRERVEQIVGDLVAVNVYRELQKVNAAARVANSGCNVVGNCSCSSSSEGGD